VLTGGEQDGTFLKRLAKTANDDNKKSGGKRIGGKASTIGDELEEVVKGAFAGDGRG